MAKPSPWSVKGVDPEAREAAKIAARRQGVPVGKWLSQTILSIAGQELKGNAQHARPPHMPQQGNGSAPMDAAANPYNSGAAGPAAQHGQDGNPGYNPGYPPGPSQAHPPALTPEAVLESIQKLASRIEQSESRTAEAIKPIAEKVIRLSDQMDEMKDRSGVSTAPVERAMVRLTERIDQIEDSAGRRPQPATPATEGGFLSRLFGRD